MASGSRSVPRWLTNVKSSSRIRGPRPAGPQITFVDSERPLKKIKGGAANCDRVLRVRVETPCRPTESPEAVSAAVQNLFPDAQIEIRDGVLVGTTGNLGRLRERIRTQRIRDTARRQLLSGRQGDRSIVRLSKQAASVGVVNFASGGPLGDIVVEIESDDLAAVIDDVAESTVEGRA